MNYNSIIISHLNLKLLDLFMLSINKPLTPCRINLALFTYYYV